MRTGYHYKIFHDFIEQENSKFLLSYLIKTFSCEGKGKNIVRKNLRSTKRIGKAHDGYRSPIFAVYPMQFKGFWKRNYLCKKERFLYTESLLIVKKCLIRGNYGGSF